jgi:hypothetical protein
MAKFRDQFLATMERATQTAPTERESPEEKFRRLADRWHRTTDHLSVTFQILADRSYKEILTMGQRVIPLILADMRKRPGHWFEALELFTGENPARRAKSHREAVEAWLEWGKQHRLG